MKNDSKDACTSLTNFIDTRPCEDKNGFKSNLERLDFLISYAIDFALASSYLRCQSLIWFLRSAIVAALIDGSIGESKDLVPSSLSKNSLIVEFRALLLDIECWLIEATLALL